MKLAQTKYNTYIKQGLILETETPDMLQILGNRKDLEQLTAIMIDNAVKHSEAGGTVRVLLGKSMARRGWKEESMLELRVSNTGKDIPEEALPHLFDRFYRADESRTHKDNSYGLGLAIARGLADKNNARISVASKDGITELSLVLPIL